VKRDYNAVIRKRKDTLNNILDVADEVGFNLFRAPLRQNRDQVELYKWLVSKKSSSGRLTSALTTSDKRKVQRFWTKSSTPATRSELGKKLSKIFKYRVYRRAERIERPVLVKLKVEEACGADEKATVAKKLKSINKYLKGKAIYGAQEVYFNSLFEWF